jgi:hypothetical protein
MRNHEDSQKIKFNVALHGTFAFVEEGEQIRALIPKIKQHANRAGNWLGETELRGGAGATYRLNVPNQERRGRFDPDRNLFVRYRKEERRPYLTLIFPWPADITSLRKAKVGRDLFADVTDIVSNNGKLHMSALQVFTYELDDFKWVNKLKLMSPGGRGGHYWEPVVQMSRHNGVNRRFVNLHIFSTEDHYSDPNQARDFNRCVELVGARVKMTPEASYQTGEIQPNQLPPDGLSAAETEDLAPRTHRMGRLGRLISNKGEAVQAWYKNDALEMGTPECADFIVRGGPTT